MIFCWWEEDLAEARSLQRPSAKYQDGMVYPWGPKQKVAKEVQRQVKKVITSSQYLGVAEVLPPTHTSPLIETHTFTYPIFDPLIYQRHTEFSPTAAGQSQSSSSFLCALSVDIDTHYLCQETHHYKLVTRAGQQLTLDHLNDNWKRRIWLSLQFERLFLVDQLDYSSISWIFFVKEQENRILLFVLGSWSHSLPGENLLLKDLSNIPHSMKFP